MDDKIFDEELFLNVNKQFLLVFFFLDRFQDEDDIFGFDRFFFRGRFFVLLFTKKFDDMDWLNDIIIVVKLVFFIFFISLKQENKLIL